MKKFGILAVSGDSSENAQRKLKDKLENVCTRNDKEHGLENEKMSKKRKSGENDEVGDVDASKRARRSEQQN